MQKAREIPLPTAGYWAKKQFGRADPRPPLPRYDGPVEGCLNNFIVGLIEAAVNIRARELGWEREEQRRREMKCRREEIERKRQEEAARIKALEDDATNWHKSKQIREYVRVVREDTIERHGKIEAGSEIDQWLTWATEQSCRLDLIL